MSFKEKFKEYKAVIAVVVATVTVTISVLTFAEDQQRDIAAQQSLIHNISYQESRITRKQDEIRENQRELDSILYFVNNDTPDIRQQRRIDYLDAEIIRLKEDIEEIRVTISLKDE